MTDGWWRIKQHAPNNFGGFKITEIAVAVVSTSDTTAVADPLSQAAVHALVLFHQDGREEYFPWASIVHAEYQPPTSEET